MPAMSRVSARFLAGLPVARWLPVVEWSRDGVEWVPLALHEGSVTAASTSQVRWSCDLTVSGVDVGRFALSPFGCLLRVRIGQVFGPGDVEWVRLGMFRARTTGRATGSATVTLSGRSFEAALIAHHFDTARVFDPTTSRLLVTRLLAESLPSARLSWRLDPNAQTAKIVVAAGDERWGVLDGDSEAGSVVKALGGRLFCDDDGTFVAAPVPSLGDAPVWTVRRSETLISSASTLTRDGVVNKVIVTGESDDDSPPVGPGVAEDLDPTSPTYTRTDPLLGGFGVQDRHYSNSNITTLGDCQRVAQAQLAPGLGLRQQVEFEAVPNFALRPDEVVDVESPEGVQPNILDQVTFTLAPTPSVSATTRAAATRLAGSVSQVADVDEEGSVG